MMQYDFDNLSPFEFEILSQDILEKREGIRFESFTEGRDDGIDLRHAPSIDKQTIVQCKRYLTTAWSSLLSNLRKEVAKVRKINPSRYILVTSCHLTPKRKEAIQTLFAPYIQEPKDILGASEVNKLIRDYPEIESANFKLWIGSTTIIQRILHASIVENTAAFLGDFEVKRKVYVQTKAFVEAMKILNEHNVCIIAGPPGVGKTTLAGMLLFHLSANGYEPVVISSDIAEGNALYAGDRKKVFLYDDFLGQTSLVDRSLDKNEDSRLLSFMRRVTLSKGQRKFILTTREYILASAKRYYERINDIDNNFRKYVLDTLSYSRGARARILYNHLYFSGLDQKALASVVRDCNYLQVIDHPNYNPRLIELSVMLSGREAVLGDAFFPFLKKTLDRPALLWQHIYEYQIAPLEQCILLALLSLPRTVRIEDLKCAVAPLYSQRDRETLTQAGFRNSLRVLEDTFIKTQVMADDCVITFNNPSIRDFMRSHLDSNIEDYAALLHSAKYFEQVEWLIDTANLRPATGLHGEETMSPLSHWLRTHVKDIQRIVQQRLRAKPCTVIYIQYGADGETRAFERYAFERRVAALHRFEWDLKLNFDRQWYSGVIQTLFQLWRDNRGDINACIELLSLAPYPKVIQHRGRDWLLNNVSTLDELEALSRLRNDLPDLFSGDKEDAFLVLYDRIVDEAVAYIEMYADEPDELQSIWWTIESLQRTVKRYVSLTKESVLERIARLESRSKNSIVSAAPVQFTGEASEEDNILHSMFYSLLQD